MRTDKTRWFLFGGLAAGAAAVLMPACGGCDIPLIGQSYVFDAPSPTACRTVSVPKKIEINRAADILFMIDNSGSMSEEQENLAKNASAYGGGGACDLGAHASAVADLKTYITTGAARGVPAEQWVPTGLPNAAAMKAIYDDCGFIERLQLFDNDFQIGIVTTDARDLEGVGATHVCTNGNYPNGRSAVPQRGCLMPIPGSANKIIRPSDGDTATISQRFRDAVRNVGTCGSALEEGIKNVRDFLTPDAGRADPSCVSDYRQFLRAPECLKADGGSACLVDQAGQPILGPDKKLVVIMLSDEEDCSTTNSPDGGPRTESLTTSSKCYSERNFLIPTGEFVSFFRGLKADPSVVSMAAIVGGTRRDPNNPIDFIPGNCRCNGAVANGAPITTCAEVRGNSISPPLCGQSVANQFCGTLPNGEIPDGGMISTPCCTADTGSRHAEVALGMDNKILDSICSQNYKSTMIDIANLINQADVVPLGETPQDIRQLTVEVKKGDGDFVTIKPWTNRSDTRFTACAGCTGTPQECSSGFALIAGCTQVKFLGSDIPPQGAEIRVSFLGAKSSTGPKCQ